MANCQIRISFNELIHDYGEDCEEHHYIFAQWAISNCKECVSKEKCAVCGINMDAPQSFPKGFPHRFRICCLCRNALLVFNGLKKCFNKEYELTIQRYKNNRKKFEEIFTL